MSRFVIFGGTTEGRELAEFLEEKKIPALVSVATEYGKALLPPMQCVKIRTGRLGNAEMRSLLETEQPEMVIDATHPYATEASHAIDVVCKECKLPLFRVKRESVLFPDDCISSAGQILEDRLPEGAMSKRALLEDAISKCALPKGSLPECLYFENIKSMISWLNQTQGIIFSTLGAKEAKALSQVNDFRQRIWLRILPLTESLEAAQNAGFPFKHLICMQGPFSSAFNEAMFRETEASILLTKDSGKTGGLLEKLTAAEKCNMTVAILSRPANPVQPTIPAQMTGSNQAAISKQETDASQSGKSNDSLITNERSLKALKAHIERLMET